MKKSLIALSLIAACGLASAYDLSVGAGRVLGGHTAVGTATLSETLPMGVDVGLNAQVAQNDRFQATTAFVGKTVNLYGLNVGARIGAGYLRANDPAQDGYTETAGLNVSYPLTQKVSVFFDSSRTFGVKNVPNRVEYTLNQVGAKFSF